MLLKLLEPLLKNWRALALCAAALLVAGFLFYMWAKSACEAKIDRANLEATEAIGKANQAALGKEMEANAKRVKDHAEIKRTIEESHDQNANDPAPALDQLFYDRVRLYR